MNLKHQNQTGKVLNWSNFKEWFLQVKRNPNRAWQIIFGSFVIATILLLAFSGYLFVKINRGEIFTVIKPETENLGTIDREKMEQVLKLFGQKALKLKEIKAGGTVYIDPSF